MEYRFIHFFWSWLLFFDYLSDYAFTTTYYFGYCFVGFFTACRLPFIPYTHGTRRQGRNVTSGTCQIFFTAACKLCDNFCSNYTYYYRSYRNWPVVSFVSCKTYRKTFCVGRKSYTLDARYC